MVNDKPKTKKRVNWDFWADNTNSDVFLDEVHNIVNSRNAMSKDNRLYSEWISQIRKIWGQSGDINLIDKVKRLPNEVFSNVWCEVLARSNNLYWITQRSRKADINFRELSHVLIKCKKLVMGKVVVIVNYIWFGDDNCDPFEMCEMGVKPKTHIFVANHYFKNYDSYEIIGRQGEYL